MNSEGGTGQLQARKGAERTGEQFFLAFPLSFGINPACKIEMTLIYAIKKKKSLLSSSPTGTWKDWRQADSV